MSRVHCRLTTDAQGNLEVEDLRSTNGTFVNGRRVRRSALAPGDRLRVGRTELVVERAGREGETPGQVFTLAFSGFRPKTLRVKT